MKLGERNTSISKSCHVMVPPKINRICCRDGNERAESRDARRSTGSGIGERLSEMKRVSTSECPRDTEKAWPSPGTQTREEARDRPDASWGGSGEGDGCCLVAPLSQPPENHRERESTLPIYTSSSSRLRSLRSRLLYPHIHHPSIDIHV